MDRSSRYGPAVLDHFRSPRNVGEIEDPTARGVAESAVCGDRVTLSIRVEAGVVKAVRFRALGCVAAIASASAATVLYEGCTVGEALRITPARISDLLGGLPAAKEACSVLAPEALRRALKVPRRPEERVLENAP